jgi:alkylation response protein AidB-like acyl-CoA dehydrogenase
VDGVELVAWEAAVPDAEGDVLPREALAWACGAAREVTAIAHQAHGGVGFALESGVHRAYRRAKSVQVWVAAVLEAVARGA